MAYKPQYGPGSSIVAENRRKYMNPGYKLEKVRDVTDEDLVLIMGHRAPGSAYPSAHPPIAEAGEPDDPIRKIVAATEGAKAGDRVRYIQFADSMYNAPSQPYLRDPTSRRTATAVSTRAPCPAVRSSSAASVTSRRSRRTSSTPSSSTPHASAYRGATVHGHSLRLDEDGMMFDMLQRCVLDKKDGVVKYVKNQIGEALDREVKVGKPMDEKWLKAHTTIFHSLGRHALPR
jgi:methyl-coenzyme M reductase gamma subunit